MLATYKHSILTTAASLATLPLVFLLVTNCTGSPLEGDWFMCEDAACAALDDEGIRFTEGDRWGALDAPGGSYTPGEAYELEQPRGTYVFDGQTITLTADGSSEQLSASASFEGELLVLQVQVHQQVCEPTPYRPGEPSPPPACHEVVRTEVVRCKRVADAGAVPYAPSPEPDDRTVEPPSIGTGDDSITGTGTK